MSKPKISDPVVRTREAKNAMATAITRALHGAPPLLLQQLDSEYRVKATHRLAFRVMTELEGEGWKERRDRGSGGADLHQAIIRGTKRVSPPILRAILAMADCHDKCDGDALDSIGDHICDIVFREMERDEIAIVPA